MPPDRDVTAAGLNFNSFDDAEVTRADAPSSHAALGRSGGREKGHPMSVSKRKLAALGAAGAAAISLIGVGAGASWTDSVQASQNVSTGNLAVQIRPDVPADGTVSGNSLTFNAVGPLGSTFHTSALQFDVRNVGSLDANTVHLALSDVASGTGGSALESGLQVKIMSWAPIWGGGSGTPVSIYDGALSAFPTSGFNMAGLIHPLQDDAYTIEFYAANLPSTAELGSVTPTVTVNYAE
jgi:predicted ribosomally synthesized peptide with SipW-like signal peptide